MKILIAINLQNGTSILNAREDPPLNCWSKRATKAKKVIEISPDLEGWILARARKNRVSPKNYGLPDDPHELHSPHMERNKNFRKFLDELVKTDDDEIISLKKWLM